MSFLATAFTLACPLACNDGRERPASAHPRVVTEEIPCAPKRVLETVCQRCHTSPARGGAPFPLITYDDVKRALDGRATAYWMEKAVAAGDMPLPPVTLPDSDRETLLTWLRAGAPPRGVYDSCNAGDADVDEGVDTGAIEETAVTKEDSGVAEETEPEVGSD